ncbi:MAG: cytochrome c biogenesis protein CcsA [bacterium]|nr:cytochrome c biogenesis protein CcsA [bacterium]
MNTWIQCVTVLLPVAYMSTALLHGMAFAGDKQPPIAGWRRASLWTALALHAVLFALHARVAGGFPELDPWLIVSSVSLTVTLLWTAVTVRSRQASAGAIVLGVVGLLQLLASAFGPVTANVLAPLNAARILHVVTSVFAAAALVLSGLYGLLHLMLYRQMRAKRFGPIFRQLPNLEQLSRTTRRAALAGFLFLTAGLNIGIGMAHAQDVSGFDYRDPQVVLTIALWIHFGMIAFSHVIRGLTARRTSIAALAGLITLIATLLMALIPGITFHE